MEHNSNENTKNEQPTPRFYYTVMVANSFVCILMTFLYVLAIFEKNSTYERIRHKQEQLENGFEVTKEKLDIMGKLKELSEKIDDMKRELEEMKQK
jgi:peptidoglycan hydrolase CwlO-like protein